VGGSGVLPGLREGAVVPDVSVVGEAVSDETELSLLGVLEDGVQGLALANLHLGVGPSRNFDNHVEDGLLLVRPQGDVVEGRQDIAGSLVLDENSVLKSVGRSDDSGGVLHAGQARSRGAQVTARL